MLAGWCGATERNGGLLDFKGFWVKFNFFSAGWSGKREGGDRGGLDLARLARGEGEGAGVLLYRRGFSLKFSSVRFRRPNGHYEHTTFGSCRNRNLACF